MIRTPFHFDNLNYELITTDVLTPSSGKRKVKKIKPTNYKMLSLQNFLVSQIYDLFNIKTSLVYTTIDKNMFLISTDKLSDEQLDIISQLSETASLKYVLFFDAALNNNYSEAWILPLMEKLYQESLREAKIYMETFANVTQMDIDQEDGKLYFSYNPLDPIEMDDFSHVIGNPELDQADQLLFNSQLTPYENSQPNDLLNFLSNKLNQLLETYYLNGYIHIDDEEFIKKYELKKVPELESVYSPKWIDRRFAKNPVKFLEDRINSLSEVKFEIIELNAVIRHNISKLLIEFNEVEDFYFDFFNEFSDGYLMVKFTDVSLMNCRKIAAIIEKCYLIAGNVTELYFSAKACALQAQKDTSGVISKTSDPFNTYIVSF